MPSSSLGWRPSLSKQKDLGSRSVTPKGAGSAAVALRFEGRNRAHQADEYLAAIAAQQMGAHPVLQTSECERMWRSIRPASPWPPASQAVEGVRCAFDRRNLSVDGLSFTSEGAYRGSLKNGDGNARGDPNA
jgi:hypothetical protein